MKSKKNVYPQSESTLNFDGIGSKYALHDK